MGGAVLCTIRDRYYTIVTIYSALKDAVKERKRRKSERKKKEEKEKKERERERKERKRERK